MAAPQPMPQPRGSTPAFGRLAAALLPLLGVGVLRLSEPLLIDGSDLPAWLAIVAPAIVAAGLAIATIALLARAISSAGPSAAIGAMAAGALAVGLGIDAAAAPASSSLPGPGTAIAAVCAGVLLVIRVPAPDQPLDTRWSRVALLAAAFLLLEAILVFGILAGDSAHDLIPWLLGAGAVGATIAAPLAWAARVVERSALPGSVLVAASMGALAVARAGSADALAGLAGLAVIAVLAARDAVTETPARDPDLDESPVLLASTSVPLLPDPFAPLPDATRARAEAEAERLARELRGTIGELLEARQIIELQRAEISRSAAVDALTGARARKAILERLVLEVAEARRYSHPIAIVLLDVDGFGTLNAERGLAVGDAVLREVGLRLRMRMRAADALGRLGNDSFLAILPHTDERGAAGFANALLRRITDRPIATDAGEVRLAVSIGVALMRPGMELSDEQLLVAADEAWGSARAAGGNRIAFDRLHGLARLDERRARDR